VGRTIKARTSSPQKARISREVRKVARARTREAKVSRIRVVKEVSKEDRDHLVVKREKEANPHQVVVANQNHLTRKARRAVSKVELPVLAVLEEMRREIPLARARIRMVEKKGVPQRVEKKEGEEGRKGKLVLEMKALEKMERLVEVIREKVGKDKGGEKKGSPERVLMVAGLRKVKVRRAPEPHEKERVP